MSFEEKSNLATLFVLVLVFGGYFVTLATGAASGSFPAAMPGMAFGPIFVGLTVGLVLLMIVSHGLLALVFSRDAMAGSDVRDREIERRADAGAGYVLGIGVFAAIGMLIFNVSGFWVANALLAAMVASELYKAVRRAVDYRRGV